MVAELDFFQGLFLKLLLFGLGCWIILKGLGHAILGNFSIDQVVIELTEITK